MVATTLLAAVVPAMHVGDADLAGSLKAGAREGIHKQSRVRTALLLVQTALSLVLLVGAGWGTGVFNIIGCWFSGSPHVVRSSTCNAIAPARRPVGVLPMSANARCASTADLNASRG